jgi:hypothetical protein
MLIHFSHALASQKENAAPKGPDTFFSSKPFIPCFKTGEFREESIPAILRQNEAAKSNRVVRQTSTFYSSPSRLSLRRSVFRYGSVQINNVLTSSYDFLRD